MEDNRRVTLVLITAVLILITLILIFSSFKFIDNYEIGYKFDKVSGEVSILKDEVNSEIVYKRGYIFKRPFLDKIHTIDLRPTQICLSNSIRVLNCKLVYFNPDGLLQFIQIHGRGDYDNTRLNDLLMPYAYDESSEYPFVYVDKSLMSTDNKEVNLILDNKNEKDSTDFK